MEKKLSLLFGLIFLLLLLVLFLGVGDHELLWTLENNYGMLKVEATLLIILREQNLYHRPKSHIMASFNALYLIGFSYSEVKL